jgi:hypothetical protein
MPWRILVDDPRSEPPDEHWGFAMEVDPRRRTVRLGLRPFDGGSLEIQSGAVARTFFPVDRAEWVEAAAWLDTDEARGLLDAIAAGYACETLWTGDPVASWTEEAWAAGNAIYARISRILGVPDV